MSYNNGPKIVTNGMVFYFDAANNRSYPGSGTTWTDITKNGNNGTLTNGPSFSTANGGGVVFDGTNDYISVPNAAVLNIGYGDHTQNVWVKPTVTTYQRIIYKRLGGLGNGYSLYINGGIFVHEILTPSTYIIMNGPAVTANVWYNVCVAVNRSSTTAMYVNGVQAATVDYSPFVGLDITNSLELILGVVNVLHGGVASYFNGTMSQVTMYNRSLSAAEVRQNYHASKGRFGL